MDKLSVSQARASLGNAVVMVTAKETELQLMVGSRYHELIESADAIISMHTTAAELRTLISKLPAAAPPAAPPAARRPTHASAAVSRRRVGGDDAFRSALSVPPRIWRALDRHQYALATRCLIRCPLFDDSRPVGALVAEQSPPGMAQAARDLRSYVDQFSARISHGARRFLAQRRWATSEYAGALASLVLLDGLSAEEVVALFFVSRLGWITRALDTVPSEPSERRSRLRSAVQSLRRSICDATRLFIGDGGGPGLFQVHVAEMVAGSVWEKLQGSALAMPSQSEIMRSATEWLATAAKLLLESSRASLKDVRTAGELAKIRQVVWDECAEEEEPGSWADACGAVVDNEQLAQVAELTTPGKGKAGGSALGGVDLWLLVFSRSFAEVGEKLLKSSLTQIRVMVQDKLDQVLTAIIGPAESESGAGPGLGARGCQSEDLIWAAEMVGDSLDRQLQELAVDARSLVQSGDSAAADALTISLYLKAVEMLAYLANHLRQTANDLAAVVSRKPEAARAVHLVDAVLLVARLARYLRVGDEHTALRSLLQVPAVLEASTPDRISIEQLQAAFEIADNDGDGQMDAEEAKEAIGAVLAGRHLAIDPELMPTMTFNEFALFSTCLLEVQEPFAYLSGTLDQIFDQAHEVWAQWVLRQPKAVLGEELRGLATSSMGAEDAGWRVEHGVWAEKVIEMEDEGGLASAMAGGSNGHYHERLWLPASVSGALSRFLFEAAAELNRVLSTTDSLSAIDLALAQRGGGVAGSGVSSVLAGSKVSSKVQSVLRRELEGALTVTYAEAAQLVASSPDCCEAAVLQLLLDAMFLGNWLAAGQPLGRTPDFGMHLFRSAVDPINYRLCAPPMLENCQAFHVGSALYLSILAPSGGTQYAAGPTAPAAAEGGASTTNTVGLAPSMRRFALLPLPLDISAATEGGSAGERGAEMDAAGLAEEEGAAGNLGAAAFGGFGFGNIRLKWG